MSHKDALLRVEQVVMRFGGFRALDGVGFGVAAGEALGLLGPNGSGKTTCINVISGVYPPSAGRVLFEGRDITGKAPHLLARMGINRTFQSPRPFLSLTVQENVELAAAYGGRNLLPSKIVEILNFLELGEFVHKPAESLNSGQQKRLDLARALATNPRLLLVDEIAAGLNPLELRKMAQCLRALAARGIALVVVEHLLSFLEEVTDRVIVLNAGREIFEGSLRAARHDQEVIRVFLGTASHAR